MKVTKVWPTVLSHGVPAVVVCAISVLWLILLDVRQRLAFHNILPKIQSLPRMDLGPTNRVEVLVRYFAISVLVEHIINAIELLLRCVEAPVVEIKLEFHPRDTFNWLIFAAKISVSFRNSFPLSPNLLENYFFYVDVLVHLNFDIVTNLNFLLLRWQINISLRIHFRIVPKVESFRLVDAMGDPIAEVIVIQLPYTFCTVFFLEQLLQVFEEMLAVRDLREHPNKVLNRDNSVMVRVQLQKGPPDWGVIILHLVLDHQLQILESLTNPRDVVFIYSNIIIIGRRVLVCRLLFTLVVTIIN